MRFDLETAPTTLPVFQSSTDPEMETSYSADRLLRRGITAAQAGDRDEARKYLTQVVALEPECSDAWMWLASISDYPEELLAFLNRVLALDPENERALEWRAATMSLMARTFVKRAVAAHGKGDHDLAQDNIDQALAYDENCADAWAWKASVTDDEAEQLSLLERVLTIDPDHVEAYEAVRQIEFRRQEELRRQEEARVEEERRLEEERRAAEEARIEEERSLEEERRAQEAARLEADRVAEERRIDGLFADARSAAIAGDNARAVELADEFLDLRADDIDAWVFRSHVAPTVEEKLAALRHALDVNPDHAAARAAYDFLSSMANVAPSNEVTGEVPAEAETTETGFAYNAVDLSPADDATEYSMGADEESLRQPAAAAAYDHTAYVEDEVYDPFSTVNFPSADDFAQSYVQPLVDETARWTSPFEKPVDAEPAAHAQPAECPFCAEPEQVAAFQCSNCNAVLSLSDLESALANEQIDRDAVSRAVIRMESEWNARDFNVDELTHLSLGHLNLGSYDAGRKFLQEALSLDPNNVVLAGHLNSLAIRLEEIERQREIDEARPKGKTILVVDDSATVRKLISGKLEKSGHLVVTACDGVEALERINEHVPDLVLLDITMPRMDGYEVCKQIRASEHAGHVPVVMISGKDGFFDKVRGRMAGTTAYVTKPFGPETLMRALEMYLLPEAEPAVRVAEYEEELAPAV